MFFCIKTKEKLVDRDSIKKPRFVAMPTTSGTGSEVTSYSVVTDKDNNTKIALNENLMIPDVAKRYTEIAKFLGLPSSNPREGVISLIEAIKILSKEINSPITIKELNVDKKEFEETLEEMADNAMMDVCTSGNPRTINKDGFIKLF